MEILAVKNLSFRYPQTDFPAVKDVSFSLERGEFAVLCGATGSGKSTLLRLLKHELEPLGEKTGQVIFDGLDLQELSPLRSASGIGFVMQKPEQQIVTDTVWHELAFGLENLNLTRNVMARRIAETASYFGIEDWYDRKTCDLSGGQKQLLSLASVMVMKPELLILDEPTSQLDPIAASEFISALRKINRELAVTILLSEHRLEEAIPVCDKLIVLENGSVSAVGDPRSVCGEMSSDSRMFPAMPSAVRLFRAVNGNGDAPLDIREGRNFIEKNYGNSLKELPAEEYVHSEKKVLEFKDVWLRYERDLPDVLCGLNFTVYENEIYCILGGNGSGKTTALSCGAALVKPYSGSVEVFGKKLKSYRNQELYRGNLAVLPQDVQTVFLKNTVSEELAGAEKAAELLPIDIGKLGGKHPYDLSGGEQQLVALAEVLTLEPKILLLDEPTKGLDAGAKRILLNVLKDLKKHGMTIVTVTHDMEFAAECADRCALLFRGEIVSEDVPRVFFAENNFYTTPACRMTAGYFDKAVTIGDAAELCLLNGGKNAADKK